MWKRLSFLILLAIFPLLSCRASINPAPSSESTYSHDGSLDPKGKSLTWWLEKCGSEIPAVREQSLGTVYRIYSTGVRDDRILPMIHNTIRSFDMRDRFGGIIVLVAMQANDAESVSLYLLYSHDEEPLVRLVATRALGIEGVESHLAVPALIERLDDNDYRTRLNAVIALSKHPDVLSQKVLSRIEKIVAEDISADAADSERIKINSAADAIKKRGISDDE